MSITNLTHIDSNSNAPRKDHEILHKLYLNFDKIKNIDISKKFTDNLLGMVQ